ncbi:unnamed protein product [Paramecium primaurelia]|uniref:Aurora kinase n=1 Tax=Paramecium primaurelia TaxID=5886 RepID=A0A8S1QNI6_PARPR|nr:unnamed protein product [Paramecium primaurelia]
MNRFCDYKSCQYFIKQPTIEQRSKLNKVMCPLCMGANYCSTRCRDLDWPIYHKEICKKSQPDRARSCNDTIDSCSTTSVRRKPEEFEIITIGNKQELGRGSYGSVKLVKDKQNGLLYAMKIMNKRQVFEYCSVENLKREIKIQRKLAHPHICKLHHYFEDKENVYLILEYAQNGSVFNYIKKRSKLPENEAFVYFFQTCLGIDYLHKNKIIHRDLKPENLLLDQDGNVKICDFGWSAESLTEKRMTFCGTYEYMAPEMLNKQPHDFSLDIWSLGILLYELLHGNAPYRGRNNEELGNKIKSGQPINFASTLSTEVITLIKGILKYIPGERLTMDQIFDHPWMVKNATNYNIDIWTFVYKTQYPTRQIPTANFQQKQKPIEIQKKEILARPISQDYNKLKEQQIYNNNTNNYKAYQNEYINKQEDFTKPRISRVSNRNEIMMHQHQLQQQQQQEEKLSFMDRVFLAFGCLNREKK